MTDTKTAPAAKPQKETWIDWLGSVPHAVAMDSAQPLLTRAELLSRLHEAGVKATDRDLVFWQSKGFIPFPTKRREGRALIALYPSWMPALIQTLRADQEAGVDLATISTDLRSLVANSFTTPFDEAVKAHHARQVAYREFSRQITSTKPALAGAARQLETILNEAIGSVRVVFSPPTVGDDPQTIQFEFAHRPPNDAESPPGVWKLGFVDRSDLADSH